MASLLESTSPRLKFLLRSPVPQPDQDAIDEWRYSRPQTYDEAVIDDVATQLRMDRYHFVEAWPALREPFMLHVEAVVRDPQPGAFQRVARELAEEALSHATRSELLALFDAGEGWGTHKLNDTRVQDLAASLRAPATKRLAQAVTTMLGRWESRGYWAVTWTTRPREIDLRDVGDRRRDRMRGEASYRPPAIRDASRG